MPMYSQILDKGWTFNGTVSAKQTFKNGIYTSLAYNYLNSQSVNYN